MITGLGTGYANKVPYLLVDVPNNVVINPELQALSYQNIKVPISTFESVQFLSLAEIEKRLDTLDPRRTPFINVLADFFSQTDSESQRYILPNTEASRTFIESKKVPFPAGQKIHPRIFSSLHLLQISGVIIALLLPQLFSLFYKTKLSFLLVVPWVWLIFIPPNEPLTAIIAVFAYYIYCLLYKERKDLKVYAKIHKQMQNILIVSSAVIVLLIAKQTGLSNFVRILIAAGILCVYPIIVFEDLIYDYRKKSRLHSVFYYIPIIERNPAVFTSYIPLYILVIANLFFCFNAEKMLVLDNTADRIINNRPERISLSDFYANAAFQAGYLFRSDYSKAMEGRDIQIVTYNREEKKVETKSVLIKQFTDNWYRDIIAQTQPLFLKFCDVSTVLKEQKSVINLNTVILMTLPIVVLLLFRLIRSLFFFKNKGLSCILLNS